MFDAKQILDAMVGSSAIGPGQGSQGAASQGGAQGGLAGMLGGALEGLTQGQGSGQGAQGGQQGGGLGGLLGQVLGGQGSQGGAGGGLASGGLPSGGLGGMLGQMFGQGRQDAPGSADTSGAATGGGGLGGLLGQLLGGGQGGQPGQSGQDIGSTLESALTKVAGPQAGGILQRAMAFAQTPQGAAVLAGLAGLVATKAGRTVSSTAAQLGGAALIGGLTYKAMKDWQAGAPASATEASTPAPAPAGSGLAPQDASHDDAALLIHAMIAAAAADGTVDPAERAKITGTMSQAGMDPEAARFLDQAFANPPSIQQLADAVSSPEQAAQVYTAARLTVDPDTPREQQFLAGLQDALGLDADLVAHLDAAAKSARA